MGGGGNYNSLSDVSPKQLASKVADAVASDQRAQFNQDVGDFIQTILEGSNDRDVEATRRHLDEIKKALAANIEEGIDIQFGGSVSKSTYCEGLSDVDCLVLLKNIDSSLTPSQFRQKFAEILKQRFPNTTINVGHLAVTVKFTDMEIQLVAAQRVDSQTIKIPSVQHEGWIQIKPTAFREKLTRVNESNSGLVVPLIKVVKRMVSVLPEQRRLEGCHIEALAADAFSAYSGKKVLKDMVYHFFEFTSQAVRKPMADVTGQSTYIDSSLGGAESLQRRNISDACSGIARRLSTAERGANFSKWKQVVEGE